MLAMCLGFWPEWAWMKETIDDDHFGRLLGARFQRIAEPPDWSRAVTLTFKGEETGCALI
ncbi:MAG: hypothetical protein M2R45_00928 [Verrucomicrobia subdivision 3 bacterium]|nr:hypothetical protein [Limisphaerales bacterium]MCS1414597.1 hypothetical protein [Limisphaerales bacterium]